MGHSAREWTMTDETLNSRKACAEDLADLLTLERRAFTELNQGRYPQELVESAAREIRMITPALIDEGHFFVLTTPDRRIAACGGWSQELPAYADDLEHGHAEIRRDTGVVQDRDVLLRHDPSDDQGDVEVGLVEGGEHRGGEGEMAGVVHRQPDRVGVLLLGRGDDRRRGLAEAEVDDLHARVAQDAGDDLDPAVVAVEPELGQDDPDGVLRGVVGVGHQTIACST